jgi:hypothetical protein
LDTTYSIWNWLFNDQDLVPMSRSRSGSVPAALLACARYRSAGLSGLLSCLTAVGGWVGGVGWGALGWEGGEEGRGAGAPGVCTELNLH